MTTADIPRTELYIDGAWRAAEQRRTFDVLEPATGRLLAQVADASATDVDTAVKAARRAFASGPWAELSGAERGALLWRLADLVEEDIEGMAALESADVGRPLAEPKFGEMPLVADTLRHFAGWADKLTGSTHDLAAPGGGNRFSYTLRVPLGVVGAITPWNAPTMITSWKLAPALAAGNTVVLKPAEDAPLTALRLAELAEQAGFPAGVLNVVPGRGAEAGAALAAHPGIAKVSFTGSTAVGRSIAAAAGPNLAKVTLELGGKSPQVIWPDADLDKAIGVAAFSVFANQGQTCASGSRIYVHRDVLDRVVEGFRARAEEITVGDPSSLDTDMGSLINERQMRQVLGYIATAREEGAQLVAGGSRRGETGFFVNPTVFVGDNSLTIAREEIFGPVATIVPFDDDDDALEMANGTDYGLTAVLWTNDAARIMRFTRELDVGVVWVNEWGPPHPAVPWLGVGASGVGEELGRAGLEAVTRLKTVNLVTS